MYIQKEGDCKLKKIEVHKELACGASKRIKLSSWSWDVAPKKKGNIYSKDGIIRVYIQEDLKGVQVSLFERE